MYCFECPKVKKRSKKREVDTEKGSADTVMEEQTDVGMIGWLKPKNGNPSL